MNSSTGAGVTVTIPTDSSANNGYNIVFINGSANSVTIQSTSSVTLGVVGAANSCRELFGQSGVWNQRSLGTVTQI